MGMKNKYTFNIPLETPAKKNSRITLKNGKNIPSAKYQQWHKAALLHLITQKRPETPIDYSVKITFYFTHGDLKRRDSDNQICSILDLLQDARIIKDDNWRIVNKMEVGNYYIKDKPDCYIEIEKYNLLGFDK